MDYRASIRQSQCPCLLAGHAPLQRTQCITIQANQSGHVLPLLAVTCKACKDTTTAYVPSCTGLPIVYPRNDLNYAENFLYMMFAMPTEPYTVDSVLAEALEAIIILHMDHEQNASTSTVRVAGEHSHTLCTLAMLAQ